MERSFPTTFTYPNDRVNYEKRLLTTDKIPLPNASFVKDELIGLGLMEAYQNREYQQNDYIGWIIRARQEKTLRKILIPSNT